MSYQDLILPIVSSAISVFSASVMTYVILKKTMSTDNILEKFDDLTNEINANETLKLKIANLGYLFGAGLAKGIGLQGGAKKGFKMNDLIGIGAEYFMRKFIPQGTTETAGEIPVG